MAAPSNSHYDVDVLVVGAGPTGLMMATELVAQGAGITLRIVDQAAARSDKSRALVVQSRTMELLQRYGLGRTLKARGVTLLGIDVNVRGRLAASIDVGEVGFADTAFPTPVTVSQAETEAILEEHLLTQLGPGHRGVEWSVTVGDITPDDEGVSVVLKRGPEGEAEEETIRCRYVVGCDGAHSVVRHHAADITFAGAAYQQNFLLCDAQVADWPARRPSRLAMYWDKGFMILIPYAEKQGILRLVAMPPAGSQVSGEHTKQHERDNAPQPEPTLDDMQRFFTDTAHITHPTTPRLHDPTWLTSFRLHHRCASAYRAGRLFIAGDAAHIHSPVGGQGMNTGIGDAVNLGWKLAAALQADKNRSSGSSSSTQARRAAALLDSYDAERRPIGERLLRTTDSMFEAATSGSLLFVWLRNFVLSWVLPVMVRFRSQRKAWIGMISQLRIRYRRSPVVGTGPGWPGTVRGGDRAPDGKVEPLVQSEAGGPSSSSSEESWLLERIWQGGKSLASHHLLLFSGAPAAPAAIDSVAPQAAAASSKTVGAAVDALRRNRNVTLHIIAAPGAEAGTLFDSDDLDPAPQVLVDKDGFLHKRYGFNLQAGYVLVRPDGHVEHIGLLSTLAELEAWLQSQGQLPSDEAAGGKVKRA